MRYRCSDAEMSPAATAKTTTTRAESQARLSNSPSGRRAASTTLRPSYGMGMWRAVVLLACLSATTHAALFSEGGAVLNQPDDATRQEYADFMENWKDSDDSHKPIFGVKDDIENLYMEDLLTEMNRQLNSPISPRYTHPKLEADLKESEEWLAQLMAEKQEEEELEKGLGQTDPLASQHQKPSAAQKQKPASEPFDLDDLLKGELMLEEELAKEQVDDKKEKESLAAERKKEELENTEQKLAKEAEEAKMHIESLESAMQTATGEPQVPQKKGQNEFVSFVEPEPQPAKQTVSGQSIDKRRLATSAEYSGNAPRYSSSSLLLLAVGTVMCVGLIGTVAGGTYYYNNRRRTETPDDGEYAPYAGTGPGFRKNKGNKGDETLAYKAQLHQYQQAKQKIICGEDAPGIIESDGEDGADEENNYSVYECPGLAPTGDIEVCNPNFAAQP